MPNALAYLRPPVELMRPEPAGTVPAEGAMAGGAMYQIKLDGFRAAAFSLPDGPVLQARSGTDLTARFPELAQALDRLPLGSVLDGEIVAWSDGRYRFSDLLRTPAARAAAGVEIRYVAFDVLALPDRHGARDVRDLSLETRWAYLEGLLARVEPPVELVMATRDRDEALLWFDALTQLGIEGLVVKPLSGVYGGARWLKIRHSDTLDAEAIAIVGSPARPRALIVRLPDGRTATTSPALDVVQAGQVANAAAALVAGSGPQRGAVHALASPLMVEVRVVSGRHLVVRFVRVRGA